LLPFTHPLWLVGFRPFFTLACLAGMAMPVLWALLFSGVISAKALPVSPLQWHAHEMYFGFGWAVMGGFLLTSTKNWVGIRGYHGGVLAAIAATWLIERAWFWVGGDLPRPLFLAGAHLFLASLVALLLWTLIRHRATDNYRRDNFFFLILLPAFLLAKALLLSETYTAAGYHLTQGLFRLAFLVMLERTLTQFMQSAFAVAIFRHPLLDNAIKALALLYAFVGAFLPAAWLALALAALLLIRFARWSPHLAFIRLDIGIMYLGYLALVAQLLLDFAAAVATPNWVGNLPVHVFTFGVMGLIIPAMLIRICNGHTGRKVQFDRRDKAVLWIMLAAFVCRIILPQIFPSLYLRWIDLAATGWLAAFALLAWRYLPYLWQPRVDGREH